MPAARSISAATISFGLVTVPIRVYAATESAGAISFNLLHGKCRSRLKQQYVCSKDGEVVAREEQVRGYEFAKDQYVVFTDAELEQLAEDSSKTLEIVEFVPIAKVDPIYFEGAYYLGPDKGGEKPYRLLSEAMRKAGKCALAKWASRGKQHLVLMRPVARGLVMQVLHYAAEVRSFEDIPVGDAAITESELKLALQLVERVSSEDFQPEAYVDDVRARYAEAVQKKVDGQEVTPIPTPAAPRGQVIDLMDALRASLARRPARVRSGKPARVLRAPRAAAAAGGRRR